jgi:3D (Asp-Asp-Asp) domain-containing protein
MSISANANEKKNPSNVLKVTATAYTSHANQTDSTPNIAAWGDKLHENSKIIAVSRDLLTKYGMKHNTKVTIDGFSGVFLVQDKMNKRWKHKIDIYMGMNLDKAYKWGKRKVTIRWIN